MTISKEMDEWLYKLSSDMKANGGYKLPKTYIIRALINAIMKLKINLNGIRDEKELEKRVEEAIKKYK